MNFEADGRRSRLKKRDQMLNIDEFAGFIAKKSSIAQ
jgi:hypothetical protein